MQKQLTGNETAYNTAVTKANAAYESAITSAESTRTAALKTASAQRTTALAQITKTKDSAIAGAERTYDQLVAALDAQYGSSSANGDTGIEGARRDASISTRDAQYYASRDTSWASALNSSMSLGTSPWIIKERTTATAQAAYSTSRATAQAAHDAALLSAIDNWQTSNRASTLSLLLAECQSREAYNQATASVYRNWEMGVGNLLGDKPEGTGYIPVRGYGEGGVGAVGGARRGDFTHFEGFEDETTTSGEVSDDGVPPRPTLPPSEESESQLLTVTAGPDYPPGPGEWILVRGNAPESCLSGKTLYCVGEWRANDSKSRNFLAEKARIDLLRREFEDIASRHNSLRTILKGDAIEELGGEKVYLENRPGFSPYVITKVIEGRLIKQLWVRTPRPGSMGQVVYTNLLMVPGEISNSDLARIYEKHLDTVEREAAAQVLIDVLMQVGGELIALRMAKIIGPGGAAAKSTQLLDNAQEVPLQKILDDAPVKTGLPELPSGYHYRTVGGRSVVARNPGRAGDLPQMHLDGNVLKSGPVPRSTGGYWDWSNVRQRLGSSGWAESGQDVHHWMIPRNGWGKNVPDVVKNQKWNLMRMPSRSEHFRVHGWSFDGQPGYNLPTRLWRGTPTPAKLTIGGGIVVVGAGYYYFSE